jgi:Kef-type K+ transport system membrane component KefB
LPHLQDNALTITLAQMGVVLVASRGLAVLMRRFGQPLVVAEVTAGILLGPSFLGRVWPEAMAALFPPASFVVLEQLSQVGLVLFMFLVGLELDPCLLRRRAWSSAMISASSILLPFVLGAGLGWGLFSSYAPPEVARSSFALFLAASMSVTAFPVLARILSERGLTTSGIGAIALACAAVDDVCAWCILAIVVAVARSHGFADALWTCALSLMFVLIMAYCVRPLLRYLERHLGNAHAAAPTGTALVFVLLALCSATSEIIGIHALFGAFLFGAIFPRDGGVARALADRMETVAVVLLMPLFFAYSGLRTDVAALNSANWGVALALLACACLGKFGGSVAAARATGLSWREASALGVLMNTRGLVELIVLNVGLELHVISPTMFSMLVVMALVTTAATTPLLCLIYPELAGRRASSAPSPASGFDLLSQGAAAAHPEARPAVLR